MIKHALSAFIVAAAALHGANALACSPPPNSLYVQLPELGRVSDSRELLKTIERAGGKAIRSIQVARGGYLVTADNGCTVGVTPQYDRPSSPGFCPRLVGVQVSEAVCE